MKYLNSLTTNSCSRRKVLANFINSILYCQPSLKLLNIKYMALVWELPNMKYLNNNYSLTIRDNYMTVSLLSNSRAVKLWINGIYLNQVHRVNLDTLMKKPNIILRVVLSTGTCYFDMMLGMFHWQRHVSWPISVL